MTQENAAAAKRPNAKKRTLWIKITAGVLLALMLIGVLALSAGKYLLEQAKKNDSSIDPLIKKSIIRIGQSNEAVRIAGELKNDYRLMLSAVKEEDVTRAEEARIKAEADIETLEDYLDSLFWRTAENLIPARDEMASVREYLDIAKAANVGLIDPLIAHMKEHPHSDLMTDGGINTEHIISYLDLAERCFPELKAISERFRAADKTLLHLADPEGIVEGGFGTIARIIEETEPFLGYLPQMRAILGSGGDRFYVFAAQNTAEIRASGGFPGSVGAVRIHDGVLSVVDFQSVYNVFPGTLPGEVEITPEESLIFTTRMYLPWDADFDPDFERVAYIWAKSYQKRSGLSVDGVVSATPAVIQRLLSFLGEVRLSDGTELNGGNAMRVLQHDLYYKYLSPEAGMPDQAGNLMTDLLFAETAKNTAELLFSSLDTEHFDDIFSVAKQSFADRTLLLWMADDSEQELIRLMGGSGALGHDAAAPALGVFFNSTSASKMGWYLDIDISVGEAAENEDGSATYPVSLRFSNRLSPDERAAAGKYILGDADGGIAGGIYIFAPAGGSLSSFGTSSGRLNTGSYKGLELIYQYTTIGMGSSVTIDCEVTTAPGASAPLKVVQTPTAQEYR